MKRIIPLLMVATLIFAHSVPNDLLFQIGKETRCLLINGVPYTHNATGFWDLYGKDTCTMFCESETLLFIKNISLITQEPGVPYGSALVVREKANNQWLCVLFIPSEDIEMLGPVRDLSFTNSAKMLIKVQFSNGYKLYRRWDK